MMLNINKLFPWLSIRNKLIIAFVGLSILPIFIVGVYSIISNTKSMKEAALRNLEHDLSLIQENTADFMANIEQDLMIIQNLYLNYDVLPTILNKEYSGKERYISFLNKELLSFADTRKIYYQLRVVDNDGNEIAYVKSNTPDSAVQFYNVVPKNELRHTPQIYYLLMVKDLAQNQIALAPAELLSKNNKFVPVISFAMPLFLKNKRVGILIADVFVKNLFRTLQTYKTFYPDEKVVLVSGEGHYLYHSQKKKSWNKLLAVRDKFNLQHEYPASIASQIRSNKKSSIIQDSDDIIFHAPLFYGYSSINRASIEHNLTIPLYLFVAVPEAVIMSPVRTYEYTFAGILVLFIIISITLSLLATRHFTTSLAILTSWLVWSLFLIDFVRQIINMFN